MNIIKPSLTRQKHSKVMKQQTEYRIRTNVCINDTDKTWKGVI